MNLIVLQNFFASYSLPSIIIATICFAMVFLLDRLVKNKAIKRLFYLLPFVIGVILNFVYNLIIGASPIFDAQVLSAGIVSGSLSIIIKVTINKILSGQKLPQSKRAIVITGLIEGHVKKDSVNLVANLIEGIFTENPDGTTECEIISKIALTIEENSQSEYDFHALATVIFASVKKLKE